MILEILAMEQRTMTFTIPIRPFTANQMYRNVAKRGRVRTTKYNDWRNTTYMLLPEIEVPALPFGLRFVFGSFYANSTDLDNWFKPIVDTMQWKWGFNDKIIIRYEATKVRTKMGADFIEFEILGGNTWNGTNG